MEFSNRFKGRDKLSSLWWENGELKKRFTKKYEMKISKNISLKNNSNKKN